MRASIERPVGGLHRALARQRERAVQQVAGRPGRRRAQIDRPLGVDRDAERLELARLGGRAVEQLLGA